MTMEASGAARADGNDSGGASRGPSSASGRSTELRNSLIRRVEQFQLLDPLLGRRSRRFAKGMRLNGGALAYTSAHAAQPLTLEEEALMVFAGVGITGFLMGDLPYHTGESYEAGSGNIMAQFFGRTIASADGIQTV
ncbi:MAG: hypothetical protein HY329_09785, partial [Chloroflexi bacterium]|nr:hypothetical protein [Chloroflexota bacterium]